MAYGGKVVKSLAARLFAGFTHFDWLSCCVYTLLFPDIHGGYKMKRDEQVNIRLTNLEYWQAHDACAYLDVSISQVCRRALRAVAAEARSKGWNPEIPVEVQGVK